MRYPEAELYTAIRDRLLDATLATHYTAAGAVAPATLGIYNQDYERAQEKLPFARPAVLLEYEPYTYSDKGGYLVADVPLVLHVVQDVQVTPYRHLTSDQDAYLALLRYPVLVQELLHDYRTDNVQLRLDGLEPDHDHAQLLVHRVRLIARISLRFTQVTP